MPTVVSTPNHRHPNDPVAVAVEVAIAINEGRTAPRPGKLAPEQLPAFRVLFEQAKRETPPRPPRAPRRGAAAHRHEQPARRPVPRVARPSTSQRPPAPPAAPDPTAGWIRLTDHEIVAAQRAGADPIHALALRRAREGQSAAERLAGRMVADALTEDDRQRRKTGAAKRPVSESIEITARLARLALEAEARGERGERVVVRGRS